MFFLCLIEIIKKTKSPKKKISIFSLNKREKIGKLNAAVNEPKEI